MDTFCRPLAIAFCDITRAYNFPAGPETVFGIFSRELALLTDGAKCRVDVRCPTSLDLRASAFCISRGDVLKGRYRISNPLHDVVNCNGHEHGNFSRAHCTSEFTYAIRRQVERARHRIRSRKVVDLKESSVRTLPVVGPLPATPNNGLGWCRAGVHFLHQANGSTKTLTVSLRGRIGRFFRPINGSSFPKDIRRAFLEIGRRQFVRLHGGAVTGLPGHVDE